MINSLIAVTEREYQERFFVHLLKVGGSGWVIMGLLSFGLIDETKLQKVWKNIQRKKIGEPEVRNR